MTTPTQAQVDKLRAALVEIGHSLSADPLEGRDSHAEILAIIGEALAGLPSPTAKPTQAQNTDRELWREREGNYYADSIFVTENGGIGINYSGSVVVKPLREWFALATPTQAQVEALKEAATFLNFMHLEGEPAAMRDQILTKANAALAAAAQVGEREVDKLVTRINKLTKDRSEILAATIERCAQVAEQMQGRPNQVLFSGAEIAAEIRALKDKT